MQFRYIEIYFGISKISYRISIYRHFSMVTIFFKYRIFGIPKFRYRYSYKKFYIDTFRYCILYRTVTNQAYLYHHSSGFDDIILINNIVTLMFDVDNSALIDLTFCLIDVCVEKVNKVLYCKFMWNITCILDEVYIHDIRPFDKVKKQGFLT